MTNPNQQELNSRFDQMIRDSQQGREVGASLTLTQQQKDELSQQIEKIKYDYQPNYELKYKLKEEG